MGSLSLLLGEAIVMHVFAKEDLLLSGIQTPSGIVNSDLVLRSRGMGMNRSYSFSHYYEGDFTCTITFI